MAAAMCQRPCRSDRSTGAPSTSAAAAGSWRWLFRLPASVLPSRRRRKRPRRGSTRARATGRTYDVASAFDATRTPTVPEIACGACIPSRPPTPPRAPRSPTSEIADRPGVAEHRPKLPPRGRQKDAHARICSAFVWPVRRRSALRVLLGCQASVEALDVGLVPRLGSIWRTCHWPSGQRRACAVAVMPMRDRPLPGEGVRARGGDEVLGLPVVDVMEPGLEGAGTEFDGRLE